MKLHLPLLTALLLTCFISTPIRLDAQAKTPQVSVAPSADSAEIVLYSDTALFDDEADTLSGFYTYHNSKHIYTEDLDGVLPFFGSLFGGMTVTMIVLLVLLFGVLPLLIVVLLCYLIYRLFRNSEPTTATTKPNPQRRAVTQVSAGAALILIDTLVFGSAGLITAVGIVLVCLGGGKLVSLHLDERKSGRDNDRQAPQDPENPTN